MHPFIRLDALVVPLDRANVDTDAIIPKQFMKSVKRTGFGVNLFDEWRYIDHGEPGQDVSTRRPNVDFALNQPRYAGAQILLTRDNFGCGSSREHAAWALADFGIRALIAPSFADIFYGNCFKNGMLPVRLDIDLEVQIVRPAGGKAIPFDIEAERKRRLLNGLDDVSLTLEQAERIREYERDRRVREPWLFV